VKIVPGAFLRAGNRVFLKSVGEKYHLKYYPLVLKFYLFNLTFAARLRFPIESGAKRGISAAGSIKHF
jgi:hypothetical protein